MKQAASDWTHALLVCRKCSKRLGGGFGKTGGQRLAKLLRRVPGLGDKRDATVGVAEVGCLGLCPKRAVVVVDTREPGRWLVVPAGSDPAEIARAALQPSPGSVTGSPSVSRE